MVPSPGRADPVTYSCYLRVGELLALQQGPRSHEELLFVVLHQSHELWFKLLLHELDDSVALVGQDSFPLAETRLRRMVTMIRQPVAQWDVLGRMTPSGYLAFRHVLEGGSGFQSAQWRKVEFTSGRKDLTYITSRGCPAPSGTTCGRASTRPRSPTSSTRHSSGTAWTTSATSCAATRSWRCSPCWRSRCSTTTRRSVTGGTGTCSR